MNWREEMTKAEIIRVLAVRYELNIRDKNSLLWVRKETLRKIMRGK